MSHFTKPLLALVIVGGLLYGVYSFTAGFDTRPTPVTSNSLFQQNNARPISSSNVCGVSGGGCGGCGGGSKVKQNTTVTKPQETDNVQTIQATFTDTDFLQPNLFTVKVGKPVVLKIDVKEDGQGCGYAIMIPGLYDTAQALSAGNTITMDFIPSKPGTYDITCGMNMIRYGTIVIE